MFGILFDDVGNPKLATKALTLTAELKKIVDSVSNESPMDEAGLLEQLAQIHQGYALIEQLEQLDGKDGAISYQVVDQVAEPLKIPRRSTEQFYNYQQTNTRTKRQKDNENAVSIVRKFNSGEISINDLSDEDRMILGRYTGNGGNLLDVESGLRGSSYEYYTPKPIASGIWDVMNDIGFGGGKVLDPCAGVGIFGATAPLNTAVDAVELDQTSGTINKLLNESDSYNVQISNFEKVASVTPDESYDAIVANVPFGSNRGRNYRDDKKYQKASLEYYFIMRSLEKLKGGGLACFLVPDRCVTGKAGKERKLRHDSSLLAEFLGAYRLPNSVFGSANADVMTCVMFYRKHNSKALDKIDTLYSSGETDVLKECNVLWDAFISGKYFQSAEGKKKILGEKLVKAIEGDMYSRDQLLTDDDILTTAKRMMKSRLPRTRINWDMFGESIAMPVSYNEGDTISHKGQLLQLQNGVWIAIEDNTSDSEYHNLLAKIDDPYNAFILGVTWEKLSGLNKFLKEMDLVQSTPSWVTQITQALKDKDQDQQEKEYTPLLISLCVNHILKEEGINSGINYKEKYSKLSDAMERYIADLALIKKTTGIVKTAVAEYKRNYSRKNGFSDLWLGNIAEEQAISLNTDQTVDGLIYRNQSQWFSLDDAKSIFGDDFDPFKNNEFCLSHDGQKICRADDYFIGNFENYLKDIDQAIENATDQQLKLKLLAQKNEAFMRVTKVDVSKLNFNLYSPYITIEEKCEFLRRSVHESARVVEVDGVKTIEFKIGTEKDKNNRLKYIGRLQVYLKSGNLSLGGIKVEGVSEQQQIEELRAFIKKIDDQFHGYVNSNIRIMNRLEEISNDPKNMQFRQYEDETSLNIEGMNPELKLHGYQTSFVRKMSRDFSGVNGFDVGLGKTFTALASVQYVQKIGVKKRTMFVVPSSTLSNWKKEATKAYTDTSDCLYVGLREDKSGNDVLQSKAYDEDLISIITNKPSKIFISFEAFERIKLKSETITDFENYIRRVDSSFMDDDSKKKQEKTEAKLEGLTAVLGKKDGSSPYFEDLGIDSIVIDEAHAFKNSSTARNFKSARYLSVGGEMSARGIDAQCKAWYVRGDSPRQDGVLLLTATPITNSPLEVYSMMSLASGHERVNSLAMGVTGADDFLNAFCLVENEDDETIDGQLVNRRVFKKLNNPMMLRGVISTVATIKTAQDVGAQIVVPEIAPVETKISLDSYTDEKLNVYKKAYRYAIDLVTDSVNPLDNEGLLAYDFVKGRFNESDDIIAHPFNLINKMSMLILDPDLDNQYTKYVVGEDQEKALNAVLKKWNAKKPKEQRGRISPHTLENDFTVKFKTDEESGKKTATYTVSVRAWAEKGNVYIDSMSWDNQQAFEDLAEKNGLNLDCTMSPKVAMMIENLKIENANVRGIMKNGEKAPYAKQIVFCDTLAMHNKLKKLIAKHAGISESQIAIITGQRNNETSKIQEVQDSFNDYGDDKYRIVIANKKAEVGINLQIGTQAIHHLTIGWTPDSLQQRNGRGARQGNKTVQVMVYYYDANGTFDSAKRTLVNNKADWINELMEGQGVESVKITGGFNNEQLRQLIDLTNEDDIQAFQEKIALDIKLRDEKDNRIRQQNLLETAVQQRELYNNISQFSGWAEREYTSLMQFATSVGKYDRILEKNSEAIKDPKKKQELIRQQALAEIKREADLKQAERIMSRLLPVLGVSAYSDSRIREDYDTAGVLKQKFNQKREKSTTRSGLFTALELSEYSTRYLRLLPDDRIREASLYTEWSFELESAKGLMEQSLKQFKQRATENGAIPAEYADEFMENGFLSNGIAVTEKTIIYLEKDPTKEIYLINEFSKSLFGIKDGKYLEIDDLELLNDSNYSIAYPSTATHDKLCRALAEFEDNLVGNSTNKKGNIFSEKFAQVKNYRKNSAEFAVEYMNKYLSVEYYPYIINPNLNLEMTAFRQAIFELQKQVILRHSSEYFYVSSDGLDKILLSDPFATRSKVQYVYDFCESLNVKAVVKDITPSVNGLVYALCLLLYQGKPMQNVLDAIENYTGNSADEFKKEILTIVAQQYEFVEDLNHKDLDFMEKIIENTYVVRSAFTKKFKELEKGE